jgi:hypothetical protein
MRLAVATLIIALAAIITSAQTLPPTLRIVPDGPDLPADLFYGTIRVKPLRLRPGTTTLVTINDADFYVSQQYVDFLSRMPDQSGFNFWTAEITGCGSDAACTELKRINVSGAFFLSIEFQETGYLVYRFHKAAFGDLSGKPVPVRRDKFIPDSRSISNGVVVGATGWQQALENNKQAYALAFVGRPEFQTAFPGTMTAAQFVDTLDANAGRVLSSTETANLVGMLGGTPSDPAKRALVVRSVAENSNLQQREFNKAFVLMQYFGYLKRNPDEGNDTDFSGYNFWLGKLNQFGGNFVNAEMVKAFIQSSEYNQRF